MLVHLALPAIAVNFICSMQLGREAVLLRQLFPHATATDFSEHKESQTQT
jgi:hypothetical protein